MAVKGEAKTDKSLNHAACLSSLLRVASTKVLYELLLVFENLIEMTALFGVLRLYKTRAGFRDQSATHIVSCIEAHQNKSDYK